MSSIPHYSASQRVVLAVGTALVSWAERSAAARDAHRRKKSAQAEARAAAVRAQHPHPRQEAEQIRNEAILALNLGPRSF